MSDSEHSQPQDGSDEDIYNDFAEFNFENEVAKLESSKEVYKQEAHDLSERVKKLTEENEELKKLNETLKKNLSTLLKTAQAEVQRKDLVISELRSKIDAFTFKRNKNISVKDKYTNTEDWQSPNDSGNVSEEKKLESLSSRVSNERKSKSSQEKESRRESTGRHESPICDNSKKLGYEDRTKNSFKHSDSNNESYDRLRGSQSFRHREKEHYESRRSFRYNYRDHLKYDSMDKKRHPDDWKYERKFRSRDSRERRRERWEVSPDRNRKRDYKRERSRSRERSPKSRNSSEFRSSREGSGFKEKERGDHKFRNSELGNTKTERRSSRNRGDSSEKGDRSQSESIATSDDQKKIFKKSLESNMFETKSPLDALYSEPVISRGFSRTSVTKEEVVKEVIRCETKTEEDTNVEEHCEEPHTEDWMLSFKNERQNDTKPMTLYSKRMMQKLVCLDNQRLKNEETSKEDTLKGDQKLSSVEKEPGELTDDENIVESSKEFQELTQLASIESKAVVEMGKYDESKKPDSEVFKEPIKVSNEKIVQKENVENDKSSEGEPIFQKGTGDVIEFSPFKNNYKLIEISLTKPQETRKEQLRSLSSGTQSQKEVESSIFNLLTSMSGVPIDRKPNETESKKVQDETESKTGVKKNKCREARSEGRITRSKTPKPKKGKVVGKKEKNEADEKEKPSSKSEKEKPSSKSEKEKPSSKSEKEKPSSKSEKEKPSSKDEKKEEPKLLEEVTPGETTQFLDFFLLTTSPSKPIMPREVEKALVEKQKESSFEESPKPVKIDAEEEKSKLKSEESDNTSVQEKKEEKDVKDCKKEVDSKKSPKPKKRVPLKTISKPIKEDKSKKRKKKESEEESETKKRKIEKPKSPRRRTRSERDSKSESQSTSSAEKTNENISLFEFFKPVAKSESKKEDKEENTSTDFKMTTTMSVTGVVCLETPDKCVEKFKNVTINEQTIYQVVDSKSVPFSPLVGSKYVEMTPRRMLKNDLMLTDSEDDSVMKSNQKSEKEARKDDKTEDEDEGEGESYDSENSERDSDSGASDLVDLL